MTIDDLDDLERERDRIARMLATRTVQGADAREARRVLERVVELLISPAAETLRAASRHELPHGKDRP